MASYESWRAAMLGSLRSQGRRSRASVADQYNRAGFGSGLQSGGIRTATEGIAAQEAVDASGINAMAADMAEERRRYDEETNQARKDAKRAAWIQGISNVAVPALSMIPGVGPAAAVAGGAAATAATPVMGQQPVPQAAPSMQGAVAGQLQPSPLYQWWQKSAGKRKQFPQYSDPFARFDTSRRY